MPIKITCTNQDINEYDSSDQIPDFNLVCIIECSVNNLTEEISLPDNMNFPNLQKFYCSDIGLKFLPNNMNLPNLLDFNCSGNELTFLPNNMNFPNLTVFDCSENKLTILPDNMNFPNLQKFNCTNNQLRFIPDNINLPNLLIFICYNNQLRFIPNNMNFPNLQTFDCSINKLTFIPDNMNFPVLQRFYCSNNQLTSLPNNMNLPNLREFYCSNNQLTALPDNMNFPYLQRFHCQDNKLTSLPVCIINFRDLRRFSYDNNEIELSLQIARFIHRMKTSSTNKLNVYTDSQNAHNSTIQLCVRDSINRITTRTDLKKYDIEKLYTLIIENTILTETSKSLLVEYIADTTVHSLLLLTFSEVLWFIIQTIITDFSDIIQVEIFKILNQEILDTDCKCFTGRMNRVINCLNGFSPLVNINIKDGEQIGNIIILVKNKLELTGTYTVEQHKIEVEKELLERNYDIETIKTWLEYID